MPTVPSDHGWCVIHSRVSYPSSTSPVQPRVSPSERNLPRTSCTTTT